MKVKCSSVVIAAGTIAMLSGLAVKCRCEKCGCSLFGFGLAGVLLGTLSLMKNQKGCLPEKLTIPLPKDALEIDLQ